MNTGVGEIHHVSVGVTDIERSLPFYRDGLGLRKTLDTIVKGPGFERLLRLAPGSTARTVFLQGPTRIGQIELIEWAVPGAESHPPARPGAPGLCVVSFAVQRTLIDRIFERIERVGGSCWTAPEASNLDGYGTIMAFIAEDPDGNMIEIVSLPSDEEIAHYRVEQPGGKA